VTNQPTNGPYHWGNRKVRTHGCFAMTTLFAVAAKLKGLFR
jgi:hypothetical protein